MEHKGGHCLVHEECILHTVVCQKAPFKLKRHQTVKVVIELCLSGGTRQSAENSILNSIATFWSISGQSESFFGLSLPNQYWSFGETEAGFGLYYFVGQAYSLLWTTTVIHDISNERQYSIKNTVTIDSLTNLCFPTSVTECTIYIRIFEILPSQ